MYVFIPFHDNSLTFPLERRREKRGEKVNLKDLSESRVCVVEQGSRENINQMPSEKEKNSRPK